MRLIYHQTHLFQTMINKNSSLASKDPNYIYRKGSRKVVKTNRGTTYIFKCYYPKKASSDEEIDFFLEALVHVGVYTQEMVDSIHKIRELSQKLEEMQGKSSETLDSKK